MLAPWKKSYDIARQHIKKQRHHFASKGPSSQGYGFYSSHVQMWERDNKEDRGWTNWHFKTTVPEKTLEIPLDSEEANLKGNEPWIVIGRTDAEPETPILWPPDAKSWIIGKDPDAWKDWGQEEKETTEDEMEDGITYSTDVSLSKLWERVKDREAWLSS